MAVGPLNPYTAFQTARAVETAATPVKTEATAGSVAQTFSDFRAAMQNAEQAAITNAVSGADPHAMVAALANAEMALDTAVTIRNKVVEAYQELLRMPV